MYWTDLMSKILTSVMAQKIVNEVAPVYSDAYVALWLFQSIGLSLDEVEEWMDEYKKQIIPQTATWSLDIWEKRYGLTTDTSMSYDQRRKRIILQMSDGHRPMNCRRLEQIISVIAGADARIEEYTGSNQFTVYISSVPTLINEDKVRDTINRVKPAHLIYEIEYEESAGDGRIYTAGAVQTYKEITLKQV
jgi:uncharacterized protein YmfQ (DUF2313 family)